MKNRFAFYKTKYTPKSKEAAAFSQRLGMELTKQAKSITDLSSGIGVSYEMARRYIVGTGMPAYGRCKEIADWLEVDFDWLYYGPDGAPKLGLVPASVSNNGNKIMTPAPLFTMSDSAIGPEVVASKQCQIPVSSSAKLGVIITTPFGVEIPVEKTHIRLFKTGDIVFIGEPNFGQHDHVLLRDKAPESFARHVIRLVEFDSSGKPLFVTSVGGADTQPLTTETHEVVGRVCGVVSVW